MQGNKFKYLNIFNHENSYKKRERFDVQHISYRYLGSFINETRKNLKIPIQTFCSECNLGKDTYYKLTRGREYPLNAYVRLLECFACYCEKNHFESLCNEFILLSRIEMCVIRHMEMDDEMKELWRKWEVSRS